MTPALSESLLWLFVINLGIVCGAGLYEARVVVPLWGRSPPESLHAPDSGHRFWVFVTTIPLTLLTLGNLVIALQSQAPRREWWLAAVTLVLIERALTFTYFIPTMLRLQRITTASPSVKATFAQWVRLNYVRNTLTLVAWLAALRVLSLPGRVP